MKKNGEIDNLATIKSHLNKSLSEITKRLSIALAAFSFTLMGASFGINISRKRSNKSLYLAILLTTVYLVSFFVAKSMDHHRLIAALLYIVPHVLIIGAAILVLRRISKGME